MEKALNKRDIFFIIPKAFAITYNDSDFLFIYILHTISKIL